MGLILNNKNPVTKAEAAKLNGKKGGRPRKHPLPVAPIEASKPIDARAQTQPDPKTDETHETHSAPVDVLESFENPYGLTPRELLFVEAYIGVAGLNASEAYRLAGFQCAPESVGPNAGRLIKKDRVAKAVQARLSVRVQQLRIMDGDEALMRITAFARADIRKLFPPESPIAKLPDDVAACIKSVTPNKYGTRIELIDPLRASELMAKVAGRLKETVKVEHTLEEIMALANKPAELHDGTAA